MIDAGRWAPNSGDRQPWRFLIMVEQDEKHLLKHIKEQHCYDAPCLIFVGADRRVYGGLGDNEAGLHIDGGAAIMQMVLAAHASHFGVCWNHFSLDLIELRPRNGEIYRAFAEKMGIPDYIEPIAIIAFGHAAFHPPVPPRMAVESLLLRAPRIDELRARPADARAFMPTAASPARAGAFPGSVAPGPAGQATAPGRRQAAASAVLPSRRQSSARAECAG